MKKIILSSLSLASVLSPIAFVISCNHSNPNEIKDGISTPQKDWKYIEISSSDAKWKNVVFPNFYAKEIKDGEIFTSIREDNDAIWRESFKLNTTTSKISFNKTVISNKSNSNIVDVKNAELEFHINKVTDTVSQSNVVLKTKNSWAMLIATSEILSQNLERLIWEFNNLGFKTKERINDFLDNSKYEVNSVVFSSSNPPKITSVSLKLKS